MRVRSRASPPLVPSPRTLGATMGKTRWLFQGLFMAPAVVGESLKGAMLLAEVFGRRYGMPCNPPPGSARTDIIQAIQVGTPDRVLSFCRQVGAWS